MPLIETKGAASAQGFGLTLGGAQPVYIEDVFSTWLYTGNGSTQTITNGIDLSTKGGLVWIKDRTSTNNNFFVDTVRGVDNYIASNLTWYQNQAGSLSIVPAFSTTGFTSGSFSGVATASNAYVSWTFRKQPKFFDIVTYTGNGVLGRAIPHNLGSTPGCIFVKCTSSAADWLVYHRSMGPTYYGILNGTFAFGTGLAAWNNTAPTSTNFTVGSYSEVNTAGETYVAYLFAHDAGGFGLTGTDNVISCGSTDGSKVTLGWEPQLILHKSSDFSDNWNVLDTMRGMPWGNQAKMLNPNLMNAEAFSSDAGTAYSPKLYGDGFQLGTIAGTHIYIAIRRGPMKVPTSGTSVFSPNTISAVTGTAVTTGFPIDMAMPLLRQNVDYKNVVDRLRGVVTTSTQTLAPILAMSDFSAEANNYYSRNWNNTGFEVPLSTQNQSAIYYNFRRAPGFFDVVCYTGNGTSNSQAHNLTVAPELVVIRRRNSTSNWVTLYGFGVSNYNYFLPGPNGTGASFLSSGYGSGEFVQSQPTSTQLPITSSASQTNASGGTYVAYLFATCAGVSKVGSYTGTGALQTINCGFTAGARFVLIKRTDSTGDWYVYDSARGISSSNDPYLLLNSSAAEVTGTNYVDTTSVGFQVTAAAPAGLNANGGTYIFLAIA